MPAVSIVVPAYNKAEYLSMCLDSLERQTFTDLEIIVVDDKSTDDTVQTVRRHMSADSRVKLVEQETNQGTLVARKTGALHTQGAYVTFMDQDDELVPTAIESLMSAMRKTPVDILHFGVQVDAANELALDAVNGMTSYMTPRPRFLQGDAVLTKAFADDGYDWNVHHKLYRGTLLREALADLEDVRLTRPDDAYLYFAIASRADSYRALSDAPWYIYHLGRGVTLGDTLTLSTFEDICVQDAKALSLVAAYVASHGDTHAQHIALQALRGKLIEHTMNEWKDNVPSSEQEEAFDIIKASWPNADIAGEVIRFMRDDARQASQYLSKQETQQSLKEFDYYHSLLEQLPVDDADVTPRYRLMKNQADIETKNLETGMLSRKRYAAQPIRVFVTTHKDVDVPGSDILQPVQVGLRPEAYRFPWAWHDDEGENISAKNPMYCELTTQYWAWKNVDAEYYGFCHYRRYFNFSDTEYEENTYGEIMDDYIDADAIAKYGLDDATMRAAIEGFDVITTRFGNLKTIIEGHGTPRKVWHAAPRLHDNDLRRCYDILVSMYPDYRQDADAFLDGNRSCFCNMFIMRKNIFQDYCAWLFPILEEFERVTDMSHYSKEALRTPGHLSERLFNIYYLHQQRTGADWRTKELQCVHFTHPEPEYPLTPAWEAQDLPVNKRPVPVVFAADDNYVPQLTTTLYSAMKNASPDRFYDVVVLQRNIAWDKQERMRKFFSQFDNMRLTFTNVDRMMSGYELTTNNPHISVETYYRFLIQQILPSYDKVLYLDSDIIINGDIAELFDTELGDNMLAAVHDIDFLGNLNVKGGKRMKYAKSTLHMADPYAYFQAGVLVLNTKAMRQAHTIEEWLGFAMQTNLIYNDQDVLNAHCQGKVVYLPWEWNVVHDLDTRVSRIFSLAPNDDFDAYMASREHPQIIHYAGYIKPWTDPDCDFASVYWRYARETPFYERLLKRVVKAVAPTVEASTTPVHQPAMGETNPLRRIIDPIAPLGSNRRELLKSVGRMVRGRK